MTEGTTVGRVAEIWAVALATLTLAGCGSQLAPPREAPGNEPVSSSETDAGGCPDAAVGDTGSPSSVEDDPRDLNEVLTDSVGQEYPEYGGHVVRDDGTLDVMVTEPVTEDRARCLQRALAAYQDDPSLAESPMDLVDAEHSWSDLTGWNLALRAGLSADDSAAFQVVSFGIDASANRITIGTEHPDRHADGLGALVAELDIPIEAVEIQREERDEPASR